MKKETKSGAPRCREKADHDFDVIAAMIDELILLRQRQEDATEQLKKLSADVRESKVSIAETRQVFDPVGLEKLIGHHTQAATRPYLYQVSKHALEASRQGGANAARLAIEETRKEMNAKATEIFSEYKISAESARKAAWGYFAASWARLAAALTVGTFFGVLVAFYVVIKGDSLAFKTRLETNPNLYCGFAKGFSQTDDQGTEYCIIPIR